LYTKRLPCRALPATTEAEAAVNLPELTKPTYLLQRLASTPTNRRAPPASFFAT
jgi:hypothetical protein